MSYDAFEPIHCFKLSLLIHALSPIWAEQPTGTSGILAFCQLPDGFRVINPGSARTRALANGCPNAQPNEISNLPEIVFGNVVAHLLVFRREITDEVAGHPGSS